MRLVNLVILSVWAAAGQAQKTDFNLGRAPTHEEIQAWDIAINPDGTELPPGSGTAKEGAQLFEVKCSACHGPAGTGGSIAPKLVGQNTITGSWPFATSIWDYINRAMPIFQEGSLSPDEVYALTAFLLEQNGVIKLTDVINRKTLPNVQMPNRSGYFPPSVSEWNTDLSRPSD